MFFIICGCSKTSGSYYEISASEAHDMINSINDIVILDVREKSEYDTGHLYNAINIPVDEVGSKFLYDVTNDKNRIIIVYCKSGVRAKTASVDLVNLGYKNVYTFGGINSWNYSIEK